MELIRGLHNLAPRHRGCVVSIGNFDGMHRGHQALVERLKRLSRQYALPSTAIIFEPTPREYFARVSNTPPPPRVAGFRGKLRGLQHAGIDCVLVLRFDRALSSLSGEAFIRQILVERLGARAVVVGDDFRFGHRRSGDLALLQQQGKVLGFEAEGLNGVLSEGERCSSTALRQALAIPDLVQVERILGRKFSVLGRVRGGLKLGRKLGMPTANLHIRHTHALAHGVYAVRARWRDQPQGLPAVASLGVRPTLNMTAPVLETHVFDFSGSLYGVEMEIEFCQFLRPQLKFDSMEALAAQMQADGDQARNYFEQLQATT
ncbi:MAG: bifunctional riboflavin kinase/FAD synthetase [Nevskia sp.]|nr:bifunctional riboflavin kinase/FAD synthetase [Nevskia sp.]